MLDGFTLAIIQSLCNEWNWRFDSSDLQIKNGTISLIIKNTIYEISQSFMVRRRYISKAPCPYTHSGNSNMYQAHGYINAMKVLHNKLGDDIEDIPSYIIQYKKAEDKDFTIIETKNFDKGKQTFKQLIRELNVTNVKRYGYYNLACVMFIEVYNNKKRLIDIRNTYINSDDITALLV